MLRKEENPKKNINTLKSFIFLSLEGGATAPLSLGMTFYELKITSYVRQFDYY